MKRRNIIILVVVLVVGIGGFIAWTKYKEKTPDLANKKPEVVTTTAELIAAFDKDTASASKTYVNKILEVSGTVVSIDTLGAVVLGEEGSPSSVTVSLDRRHIDDHKKIRVGSPAVMKGRCTGYSKSGSADPDDLLAGLGTTIELNFALVIDKK